MSGPTKPWTRLRRIWIGPVLGLACVTAAALLAVFLSDWLRRPEALRAKGPLELLFLYDEETLQNTLGNLASTVVAVLGIVITVVAIVVQLAATRYTPRVTELFFRERTNLFVLGFFVVTCILAVWVSLAVGAGFVPRASVITAVLGVTASLLLIVPYFAYVFDFLDPERIVERIQENALGAIAGLEPSGVERAQEQLHRAIEQLADIAVAATGQQDRIISAKAVDALRVLAVQYTRVKPGLPRSWFELGPVLAASPDFQAMNAGAVAALIQDGLWLEWVVLRKYQTIYNGALSDDPDMNYLVAIDTRYLGEAILTGGTRPALALVVKFMNTYLRATLNRRQVRTAYNLLNQYRQLAEAAVVAEQPELVTEIAGYLRYYAQVSHGLELGFVTETIAYDLAALCELAHGSRSRAHDPLLGALLEVDKEAESEAQESTLRGVRKAQVRLAAYYLSRDDAATARRIFMDMEQERPERLASIRDEILRITSPDFWEVIDRGANFDYMDEAKKAHLKVFFSWFEKVPPVDTAQLQRPSRDHPSAPTLERVSGTRP